MPNKLKKINLRSLIRSERKTVTLRELASRSKFAHFKVLSGQYYLNGIPREIKDVLKGIKALFKLFIILISPIILALLAKMQLNRYREMADKNPKLLDTTTIQEKSYHLSFRK